MSRHGESHPEHLHTHPRRGHHRPHGDARRAGQGEGRPSRFGFRRHFFSRDERIAGLEHYLSDLQAEAQAVEEKLATLKAAG